MSSSNNLLESIGNRGNASSNTISNINNLGKRNQGILGNLNVNFGNVRNDLTNGLENSYNKIRNQYNSYPTWQRGLIIFGLITLVAIIAYLIYYRTWGNPLRQQIFIPDLRNDASRPYIYIDNNGQRWDYIPHKDIPQKAPGQYTYSMWLYINGQPNNVDGKYWGSYRFSEWKHVMHRGDRLINGQVKTQSPGFWLAPRTNRLYAAISTRGDIEHITLADIDLDKWVNIVFVLNQNIIEIYKNGKLEKTLTLMHPPIAKGQTNLWITQDGGFPGNLAYIQYFNESLPPGQVQILYNANQSVFEKDMKQRNKSYTTGYSPGSPIQPTPEPVPDPDSGDGGGSGDGNGQLGPGGSPVCK